jgi:hypothetical protein
MGPPVRTALGLAAVANLVVAGGFALQRPWALAWWPWPTGPLSYVFLASMLAAVGAAAAWIAFSGETGSLPAGFLNLAVTFGGITIYPTLLGDATEISTTAGVVIAALAVLNVGLFLWTLRLPPPGSEPVPWLLRGSYILFTLILLGVGIALILRTPGVMPWPIDEDVSVVFGWIFFGDAWYFAYAVARPDWQSARAQLWSFLAYDVVLFGPLAASLGDVAPELLPNVIVYLAVLAYSGVLAVHYLIANPATRGWGAERPTRT